MKGKGILLHNWNLKEKSEKIYSFIIKVKEEDDFDEGNDADDDTMW